MKTVRYSMLMQSMRLGLLAVVLAVFVGPGSATGQVSDPSSISAKVHRSMTRRLTQAGGRPVKAWIMFRRDKGVESLSQLRSALDQIEQRYNGRAVQRRRLRRTRPGLFDLDDLPVPPHFIEGVRRTGADIRVVSRWINGVSARVTAAQIRQIAELPYVIKIQPVLRGRTIVPTNITPADPTNVAQADSATHRPQAAVGSAAFYGEAAEQLLQINLISLHDLGFTGAGVRVGILDTGFQRSHTAFNQPGHVVDIIAEYDFVDDDPDTSFQVGDPAGQHSHGTLILGTLGAYWPNLLVGAAYDASFILCKTEDTTAEYPAEEDNYVAGLEFIEANGGDLATSSLGYIDWYTQADLDGATAVTTLAVNIATANGLHCLTAAGNSGHDADPGTSRLIAPADAMKVITVGAASSTGAIAGFSSDGPTADGRVKPEVLARGINTRTVNPNNDTTTTGASGTSLSTPLAAGVVACLVQAHPDWTVDQMRQRLFETADYFVANQTFDPQFVLGYGMIDASAAAGATGADCNNNGVDDLVDISNGTSTDCNANGIPDECEPNQDCNNNTVQDICDIAAGTSTDCNGDNVPDECLGCTTDCECPEPTPDACTYGACVAGACTTLPNIFGDLNHDGSVSLFDLFCVIDGLGGDFSNCPRREIDISPCTGNDLINIFDLFAILNALQGLDPCCAP